MNDNTDRQSKPGPLDGIKVVEYGVFHAGPGGGAILGDLGAEVIKIEAGAGDPERYWTKVGSIDMSTTNGQSLMHEVSNRNKKGIYLDIKKEKGREVLHRLVTEADVFLTNLRKSTKTKLQIDYASLSKVNPKIIHANVSGYGPQGPMSDLGAFDPLGQARSGMTFATGHDEPVLLHLGILDQATAIAASHAIITALFVRERQGIGQEVHVSLYSTALWLQHPNLMIANALRVNPCVPSARHEHSPLRNRFCCKDGKWILGTHHPEEKYWAVFCKATGQEHLLHDSRFTDASGKPVTYRELIHIFDKVFAARTRDEWMQIFQKHKLMFSSVQRIEEVEKDEQALVNGYVVPFDYKGFGDINIPGYPIHFSQNRAGTRQPAPAMGEHTETVLREIGYSALEIEALRQDGIIN
ncbi:MAG: CoA transferase [Desulfobacteraceae bacterium]|nr:MAG: CoA transferase [Desulfobacteraceae bacterium]